MCLKNKKEFSKKNYDILNQKGFNSFKTCSTLWKKYNKKRKLNYNVKLFKSYYPYTPLLYLRKLHKKVDVKKPAHLYMFYKFRDHLEAQPVYRAVKIKKFKGAESTTRFKFIRPDPIKFWIKQYTPWFLNVKKIKKLLNNKINYKNFLYYLRNKYDIKNIKNKQKSWQVLSKNFQVKTNISANVCINKFKKPKKLLKDYTYAMIRKEKNILRHMKKQKQKQKYNCILAWPFIIIIYANKVIIYSIYRKIKYIVNLNFKKSQVKYELMLSKKKSENKKGFYPLQKKILTLLYNVKNFKLNQIFYKNYLSNLNNFYKKFKYWKKKDYHSIPSLIDYNFRQYKKQYYNDLQCNNILKYYKLYNLYFFWFLVNYKKIMQLYIYIILNLWLRFFYLLKKKINKEYIKLLFIFNKSKKIYNNNKEVEDYLMNMYLTFINFDISLFKMNFLMTAVVHKRFIFDLNNNLKNLYISLYQKNLINIKQVKLNLLDIYNSTNYKCKVNSNKWFKVLNTKMLHFKEWGALKKQKELRIFRRRLIKRGIKNFFFFFKGKRYKKISSIYNWNTRW